MYYKLHKCWGDESSNFCVFSILKSFITKNLLRATSCRKCDVPMYTITAVVFSEGHSSFALVEVVPLLFLFCLAAPCDMP